MINDKINPQLGAVDNQTDMSSTSLDLPENIQALLTIPISQTMGQPSSIPSTNTITQRPISYQEGGMVQPAGIQPMGMQSQQPMNAEVMDMEVGKMMSENPELVARIRAGIEAGLQSGELSMEELNMAIELAKAVLQDPSMYPQIRQFAIQKGLATEEDLPTEYDEGLIIALIMASKALEADVQFQGAQPMQGMQEMQDGGVLKGLPHEKGGIPVKVAGNQIAEMEGGEYVIPTHVVKAKGTEFFDKMLANYEDKPDAS
tara:strand:+ start:289 stop:1065 length:777 start_codon:yes stop_codon:yes gene_type:complete